MIYRSCGKQHVRADIGGSYDKMHHIHRREEESESVNDKTDIVEFIR